MTLREDYVLDIELEQDVSVNQKLWQEENRSGAHTTQELEPLSLQAPAYII